MQGPLGRSGAGGSALLLCTLCLLASTSFKPSAARCAAFGSSEQRSKLPGRRTAYFSTDRP